MRRIGRVESACLVLSASFVGTLPSASASPVVDFEDWSSGSALFTSAHSRGFVFTAPSSFRIAPDLNDHSQNGTLALINTGGGTLTMRSGAGESFALLFADFGESTLEAPSTSVLVTGLLSDGGSISRVVELDGIPLGFETVGFSGFTDLESVNFQALGGIERFSLDNILVPEPGTLFLFGLGILVAMRERPDGFAARWLARIEDLPASRRFVR